MRTTPKSGVSHCHRLDAWLRGQISLPKRGDSPVETLRFLVVERLGTTQRHARELMHIGEVADPSLAWAWHAASAIVNDCMKAPAKRRCLAEETARVQMAALFERCLERVEALEGAAEFWLADEDESAAAVRDEFVLLVDCLALCLVECGDLRARWYLRDEAAGLLQHADSTSDEAARYARLLIGLSYEPACEWRPGQGCQGTLRNAVDDGQRSLWGAMPHVLREDAATTQDQRDQLAAARLRDLPAQQSEPPPPAPVDDGPSLLVLASADHLPGSAESGKDKPGRQVSSTARGEWAPFAGRRWPLVRVPDLAVARAILIREFPYAESIVDAVLGDLVGRPHVFVRPMLLVGGPGSGKTRLARRFAEVLGLACQVYGCAGQADGAFVGTSRQWSTGRASVPLQILKRISTAAAVLVLDELEKASSRRDNGSLLDALLPFLTDDSKRIHDPYVETTVDLSGVSFIATANTVSGLRASHPALIDRFRVYSMPAPRPEDLSTVCRTVLADLRAERGLGVEWLPDLDGEELALVAEHYDGGSLRVVRRLCETLVAGREALAIRQ